MTFGGVTQWIATDMRSHTTRTLVASFGVAIGIAALVFFLALGEGLRRFAVTATTDDTLLEVVPRSMELGVFKLSRPGLLGNTGIDERTLAQLRNIDGVKAVYPRRLLRLPVMVEGGGRLIGKDLASDVFVEGIDPALFPVSETDPLPVIINDQLLGLFNSSVAEAVGAPKLAQDALLGFTFTLVVGRSYLMGTNGAKHTAALKARIAGFSPYAMRLGMSIPMPLLDKLEREYRSEQTPPLYTAALVRAQDAATASTIATKLDRLGLKVSDADRRAGDAIRLLTLALSLIAALVLLLAAFNIAHLLFAQIVERRAEIALLKALGASPLQLLFLILTQAALLGLLGGALGSALGYALTLYGESALRGFVSDIPLRPDRFFVFSPQLLPLGTGIALACTLLGALFPALKAMRESPARVLSTVED